MTAALYALLDAGALSPLSYYFARFLSQGTGQGPDSLLAQSAAVLSSKVCARAWICVCCRPVANTTNSSPPSRATVSEFRDTA